MNECVNGYIKQESKNLRKETREERKEGRQEGRKEGRKEKEIKGRQSTVCFYQELATRPLIQLFFIICSAMDY